MVKLRSILKWGFIGLILLFIYAPILLLTVYSFNETETIDNCIKSVGILSDETIVAQHPWVTDVKGEIERKKEEKKENFDEYAGAFGANPLTSNTDDEGGVGDAE